ncbi:Transcription factor IIIB 90 kDa subunit-like Protein [Tribolium castaneum]|uniref:Transcription factor IIIB 90 kDa subunit-like Protein n=2 Tax=Tribolium castaneum TaxID=7070 RepID=D6WSI6_TRICA|nr:Transcription factor IIIB 90 kDa subunit-like Protein [Tribolium castaneum]
MKRDSIHSGRRPSGLCGAALLIAARLHEFGRSASDIVKIVKVHESTLRKRLIEFGDTPSSALTLEEFMTVDLEEEQDPPSFKAARKKDKERLQRLMEEEAESITELQQEIEMQLNRDAKMKSRKKKERDTEEIQETNRFIRESTMGTINQIIQEEAIEDPEIAKEPVKELGPDIASMGLASSLEDTSNAVQPPQPLDVDMTFDDIDDEELDSYIMSEHESQNKNAIWLKRNAAFLEEQKIKAEKLQKEREEGKPEKKKRRNVRRKPIGPTNSAGEAIEKILQEKKISSKINYDVLKSLNASLKSGEDETAAKKPRLETTEKPQNIKILGRNKKVDVGLPVVEEPKPEKKDEAPEEEELDEDYEEEENPVEETVKENGLLEMLRQHREDGEEEQEYFGYEEEDY